MVLNKPVYYDEDGKRARFFTFYTYTGSLTVIKLYEDGSISDIHQVITVTTSITANKFVHTLIRKGTNCTFRCKQVSFLFQTTHESIRRPR